MVRTRGSGFSRDLVLLIAAKAAPTLCFVQLLHNVEYHELNFKLSVNRFNLQK
jgi:hypothetical protein